MLRYPFRVFIEEGGDTDAPGGGGGETVVVDPPAEQPVDTGGAPEAGAGTPVAGDEPTYVLDTMPARGTPEYIEKFNELPIEDRVKVEQEIAEGHEQKIKEEGDETPKEEDKKPDEAGKKPDDTGTKPDETGKKAAPRDVGEWTPEDLAKLDEPSQNRIRAMQDIITQFEPFMDADLQKGLDIFQNDPFIKARIEEIQNKGPLSLPDAVQQEFDVNSYLTEEDKKAYELLDDVGKQGFSNALAKAYEHGAKITRVQVETESAAHVQVAERVGLFEKQLDTLAGSNPSLKAPSDKDGNPVPYRDKTNPLYEYVQWAADVNNLGDEWLARHGHKAGYATYLAVTGKSDEAMANVAKSTRTQFIKNLEAADKDIAATAGRDSQTPAGGKKEMDGIDLDLYKKDMTYRRKIFDGANRELKGRLEHFAATGEIPTKVPT